MVRISLIHRFIGLGLVLALLAGILPLVAQDNNPATISMTGAVEAVNDRTIVVSGVDVVLSTASTSIPNLQVGVVVQVSGTFTNGVIFATAIVIINPTATTETPTPTPESTAIVTPAPESTAVVTPTPTPTDNGDVIIVIDGPVSAINVNIITIYNVMVSVAPNNPILTVIKVGDMAHIEGKQDKTGVIVATVVTLTTATVSLNGQVTAINGNVVVINGNNVQFDPDDDTLTLIKVGDILNIEGNYQGSGTTLIFIVINVTIVNNITITNTITLPPNCKISKNGHIKCSKKHHK